jgi:hypothetical protein
MPVIKTPVPPKRKKGGRKGGRKEQMEEGRKESKNCGEEW